VGALLVVVQDVAGLFARASCEYVDGAMAIGFGLAAIVLCTGVPVLDGIPADDVNAVRGYRGAPEGDVDALARAIVAMSELAVHEPGVVEAEVNPLLVGPADRECRPWTRWSGAAEPIGRCVDVNQHWGNSSRGGGLVTRRCSG
jgi:ATP-grasp domain-containing protein